MPTSPAPAPNRPRDLDTAHLGFEWVGEANVLLAIHVNGSVSDEVWDRYVVAVRTHQGPELRCLVWNEGGRPTMAQQRRLLEATQGSRAPVAIVSSSVAARFIVSIFALANRHVRFYPASDAEAALYYLCTDDRMRAHLKNVLSHLCIQAGVALP